MPLNCWWRNIARSGRSGRKAEARAVTDENISGTQTRRGSMSVNSDVTPAMSGLFQQHILPSMDRTFIDRRASDSERQRARDVAQAVLDGRTTVLEAARALVSLAHTDAIANEEDRRFIIAIDSETDHLPVGVVRQLWASDALKEKDVEIARVEELCMADFIETCRRIANPSRSANE